MTRSIRESGPESTRKTKIHDRRDMIEMLLRRAEVLSARDRALLGAVYDRGMRASEFACACEQQPVRIRRHITRLLKRLDSPAFRYVLCNRRHMPRERRDVADAVILRGETQRQTATRLGLTLHRLRRELDHIRAKAEDAL